MSTLATLAGLVEARQDIKKSRFVAHAGPVTSEIDAKAFIAAHSDPGAGHNCWAYRIGAVYHFTDDGEPSGTAGKPILQAIDGAGLDRVAIVVSRWFGGILLGGGGLIRAYGGTAGLCLRSGPTLALIETIDAQIECVFADLALLEGRLAGLPEVEMGAPRFHDTGATLTLKVHRSEAVNLADRVIGWTHGRARFKPEDGG